MANKKSFKEDLAGLANPAQDYVTIPAEGAVAQPPAPQTQAPEGYKVNPLYIEKRSKRLQLLLQPSLYEKVKSKAEKEGFTSVNDFVHSTLENATKGE